MTTDTVCKALALVRPGDDDADTPHGSFDIILSTGSRDRDGEEVKSAEWITPLPDHITMDVDHGMSVKSTVGSGKPSINAQGQLVVHGTYASDAESQVVRTKVNEGHIRFTSVAFRRTTRTDQKGVKGVARELLNGAFVAIPANLDSIVIGSKAGARNSQSDASSIQAIHDAAHALGAMCVAPDSEAKSIDLVDAATKAVLDAEATSDSDAAEAAATKAAATAAEATRERIKSLAATKGITS